jgi:hypothetical protein
MSRDRNPWAVSGLVLAGLLATGAPLAQWAPPAPGPYYGPAGPYGPRVLTYEDRDFFFNPFGPTWTDIRRVERRGFWQGLGVPGQVPSPLGPSPTEIRRQERMMLHRSLGLVR